MSLARAQYVERVVDRVEGLLGAQRAALPTDFRVKDVWGPQTDWRLTVQVGPTSEVSGWHDCEEVFREIQETINREFQDDPLYFGIDILTPIHFLGRLGARYRLEAAQQAVDNESYRNVRLDKDETNG